MRELPQDFSRVVSEAIYSEEVEILEENGRWVLIRTKVDQYAGWLLKEAVVQQPKDFFDSAKIRRLKAHLYSITDTKLGPILSLPFGSRLKILQICDERWIKVALLDGREAFVQRGDIAFETKILTKKEIVEFSKEFMGLPYTWGGRSSFGFDCSGFVQMLYREMGKNISRDAKDQILWEWFAPVEVEKGEPGDLVFFGREEKKVSHVGMLIGDQKFIHATVQELQPWIHISDLRNSPWDGSGMFSFRAVRRFFAIAKSAAATQNAMLHSL